MIFYLVQQHHTLASALRTSLETRAGEEEFVSCTLLHPLDDHLEVVVPTEQLLRQALQDLKSGLGKVRTAVDRASRSNRSNFP